MQEIPIEHHPLKPFLPNGAKVLLLGSFPPKRERWSMEFFYPNFQNDMWRILGLIFFEDKNYFIADGLRRFCVDRVVGFCAEKGIAIFDAATTVRRLNDNASDKFLEIVEPTDVAGLLTRLPDCDAIVTTGQKATEVICEITGAVAPKVGCSSVIELGGRQVAFSRMPSSSRAYPLSIEKKAEVYRSMFKRLNVL